MVGISKVLKAIIDAEVTTRKLRNGYTIEKGSGVLFFLDEREIYHGIYLRIEDGELFAPVPYDGELRTLEDMDTYYKAMQKNSEVE